MAGNLLKGKVDVEGVLVLGEGVTLAKTGGQGSDPSELPTSAACDYMS